MNIVDTLKYGLLCISLATSHLSYCKTTAAIEKESAQTIQRLYQSNKHLEQASMAERIDWFSDHFKGTQYVLGSLGEGPQGRYDQYPRYRTDAFDCDTYVNTVISLALANSLSGFQRCMNLNRYKDGKVTYIQRNHFTSLDWNKNNQQRGILKDITVDIKDQQQQKVAVMAQALINKSSWYAHKSVNNVRLESNKKQQVRLQELKTKGANLETTQANIPYLPLSALFKNNQPNTYLFSQIPQAAIIEIVRPNWDLRQQIGTALNVSHLGFAIWNKGILYFREASSEYDKVVDVPLIDYLDKARKSPTIKGINVQVLVPERPLRECS